MPTEPNTFMDEIMEYASGDPAFGDWLRAVNKLLRAKSGVTLFDIPDIAYRDGFDSGCKPEDFFEDEVMTVLYEEGFPDE